MRAVRSCHRTQTLPGTLPLCCHYSCFSVVRYRESGCVLGRKSKGRVGLTFFAVLCKSAGPPQASFQVPALADSFCRPGWEFLCATTSILNIHIHIHTHPSLLASGRDLAPLLPPPNCGGCFPNREHRHSRGLELRRTGDVEQPVFDYCAQVTPVQPSQQQPKLASLAPSVHLGAFAESRRCVSLQLLHLAALAAPRETSNLPDSASCPYAS